MSRARQPQVLTNASGQAMLDQFVYRCLHDLRGSVRALEELPNWIAEDLDDAGIPIPEGPRKSLDLLQTHAVKLNTMLDQLARYAAIEPRAGERIRLSQCLHSTLQDLQISEQARLRASFVPDSLVLNEETLQSILRILIAGAIERNECPVRIAIVGRLRGDHWCLSMRDDGISLAPDQAEGLFHPQTLFEPLAAGRDGLGFALLQKIADVHSGSLNILPVKRPHHGATLSLCLPVQQC